MSKNQQNHMDKVRQMIKNKAYNFQPKKYADSSSDSESSGDTP